MFTRLRFAVVLAAVTAMSACTEQKEVAGPCLDCPFVVVQGTVRGTDGPIATKITAQRIGEDSEWSDRIVSPTDSIGAYRLLAPPGRYLLWVAEEPELGPYRSFNWTEDGLVYGGNLDTLTLSLEDGVQSMDFAFGSLQVNFSAPHNAAGAPIDLDVHPVQISTRIHGSGWIDSGVAQIDVPTLPVGKYEVRISAYLSGSSTGFWYPGAQDRSDATPVNVAPLERTVLAVALPEKGHLRGSVTGSWQAMDYGGLPAVRLVSSSDSLNVVTSADVAVDGSFDLAVVAPVSGRVQIVMGYRYRWIGGAHFEDATIFELAPGRSVEGADFVESGLRVFFELPIPEDSNSHGVIFTLTDSEKRLLFKAPESFSAKSYLAIPNLTVGTYYFYARPRRFGRASWVPEWFEGSQWLAAATPIIIASEGDVVDVVMRPSVGGTLPGRLRTSGGFPVIYVALVLVDTSDPRHQVLADLVADTSGRFVVHGLRTGNWKIARFGYGGADYWYPGTYDRSQATPIPVTEGEESPMVEWRLQP